MSNENVTTEVVVEEAIALETTQDVVGAEVAEETSAVEAQELAEGDLGETTIEEVEKMVLTAEQQAEHAAHAQLAANVANIILQQTDFLKLVTRHTTNAILHASAAFKRNSEERPIYIVGRENNDNHTFIMDIHSIDVQNPLASRFSFVYLQPGFARDNHEAWVAHTDLAVDIAALLLAQVIDLNAKTGDRFYGRVYQPRSELIPDPLQELAEGGTEPAVIVESAEVVEGAVAEVSEVAQ